MGFEPYTLFWLDLIIVFIPGVCFFRSGTCSDWVLTFALASLWQTFSCALQDSPVAELILYHDLPISFSTSKVFLSGFYEMKHRNSIGDKRLLGMFQNGWIKLLLNNLLWIQMVQGLQWQTSKKAICFKFFCVPLMSPLCHWRLNRPAWELLLSVVPPHGPNLHNLKL